MTDENPYQPPKHTGPARYEWPLWRRIVYSLAAIAIVYLLCGVVASWQTFRHCAGNANRPMLQTLVDFIAEWSQPVDRASERKSDWAVGVK